MLKNTIFLVYNIAYANKQNIIDLIPFCSAIKSLKMMMNYPQNN